MIKSARYKQKTFFYLDGREEETIEAFFREKPDRIISYPALLEISSLLGVELSKNRKRDIVKRLKGQHEMYWKSRKGGSKENLRILSRVARSSSENQLKDI